MREIKTLKRLTPLTLSLAIALVGVLSLSSGVGAASVTETNIVTSSWQAYYTSNPECDTIYGSAALICSPTADNPYFPGISNQWPLNFNDLASGGGFWHFGPEDTKYIGNNALLYSEIEDYLYTPGAIIWRIDREKVTKSKVTKMVGTDLYKKLTIRNCNTVRKLLSLAQSS
jgi:hypothetical protein